MGTIRERLKGRTGVPNYLVGPDPVSCFTYNHIGPKEIGGKRKEDPKSHLKSPKLTFAIA